MNIEFHYYITKYLALEAGFDKDEAEIIAYSSQFTDNNFSSVRVLTPAGKLYENLVTQTPDITKPEKNYIRRYILFHYIPGDPTSAKVQRKDGKMHLLMTTAAGNYAQEIFYHTTRNNNLYIMGMVSHMLSDTFAHQNFIGTLDEMNSMSIVWEKSKPNIGHAEAGFKPDIPNLIWIDPRLIDENAEINNRERIIFAARKLYSNFIMATSGENNWAAVKKNITEIISDTITEAQLHLYEEQKTQRIEQYKKLFKEFGAEEDYSPEKWFNEAVEEKLDAKKWTPKDLTKTEFHFREDYRKSNWFNFQEAVKQYQRNAEIILRPIIVSLDMKEW